MSLRIIRIVLQTVIFALLLSLFFVSWNVSGFFQSVSFFQFFPLLFRSIGAGGALPLIVFIGIIVGTILFGRFYCAVLCPLGTVQDGIFFLSRRRERKKMGFTPSLPFIQIPVLLGVVITAVFGSTLLFSLLDPFSIFGRTSALLVQPAAILGGGLGSSILQLFGIYPIIPEKLPLFVPVVFTVSAGIFAFAAVLAFFRGRLYCTAVCPVGSILGWCSGRPLMKLSIDAAACTGCMRCSRQCRSSCIDISEHTVNTTRCTLCFDCIPACPEKAIAFSKAPVRSKQSEISDISRRRFITGAAIAAGSIASVAAAAAVSPKNASVLFTVPDEGPVAPPGSKGYRHLISLCTSCYACVSACPTRVIRPALLEYGTAGLFKPVLDYNHGYCEYGCTNCIEVCPTGAIDTVSLTEKKRIQIGLSNLDIEKCVVKLNGEDCGACAEACPTRAVVMVEYDDGLFYPETRNDYCIGCGACEHACPARPLAITVAGEAEHGIASLVHVKAEPIKADEGNKEEEFPF